jgi:hypothetical protein
MPGVTKVTGTVRSKNPLKGAVEILPVCDNRPLTRFDDLLHCFVKCSVFFSHHHRLPLFRVNTVLRYRRDYTMPHYPSYLQVTISLQVYQKGNKRVQQRK